MKILSYALLIVFHPLECFDIIKRENKNNKILPSVFIYIIAFLMNYINIFIIHFPLSTKLPINANLLLEAAMVVIPLLSWAIGSYAVTAIMNGESRFKEVFVSSSYSLIPYIIIFPFIGIVSNILSFEELGIFNALHSILLIWVVILLFAGLIRLNDYSFGKAVAVAVLSLIAIIVMWAVCLLLFSLTIQLITFFTNLGKEINFKYIN